MAAGTRPTRASARLARLFLSLVLAASCLFVDLVPGFGSSPAAAQERSRTIMDMLFGGPPRRRYIDPPPRRVLRKKVRQGRQQNARSGNRRPASTRGARRGAAAAAVAAAPAIPVKSPTAKPVLVVGDFMAGSLAGGLEETVKLNAEVAIISQSDGSSGFVRDDHYDWLAKIGPLIDETKPAVVVAMLGSNDRQAISVDGKSHAPRSEAWVAEYEQRVNAFAKTVQDKNVPLVWVGMPAFKFDRMTDDMAYLNEIYRKAATMSGGGEFVDVWEGFVDSDGAFTYTGPDIAGQTARLRNADGITMTPDGAEKLAFFAEKPILRLLGTTADGTALAALAPGEITSALAPPIANAANATSTPAVSLGDPALDGGDALLGAAAAVATSDQPSPRDRLVLSGAPMPAPVGRADQGFGWAEKTAAVVPVTAEKDVPFRGSLDLSKMRDPELPETPTLPASAHSNVEKLDAVPQDEARTVAPVAAAAPVASTGPVPTPAAPQEPLASAPVPAPTNPGPAVSPPVSASPFAADQSAR